MLFKTDLVAIFTDDHAVMCLGGLLFKQISFHS